MWQVYDDIPKLNKPTVRFIYILMDVPIYSYYLRYELTRIVLRYIK
jgi:hypothetical protein